jgi:uncharacterized protein
MISDYSTTINSIEFARKALEIHDTIRVSQFTRLLDLLDSNAGVIDFQLIGSAAADGSLQLSLKVQGTLLLSCQRCLDPFEFMLDIASSFTLVANEEAIPLSDDEGDDKDYLVEDVNLRVWDLVEDEVLLALPLAPKHSIEKCRAGDKLNELKKPSPFAVLANLKMNAASGKS